MYVIYHDPTKRSFEYDHKMKQLQLISAHECELSPKHLLCQDVVFHRIPISSVFGIQGMPPIMQKKISWDQGCKK